MKRPVLVAALLLLVACTPRPSATPSFTPSGSLDSFYQQTLDWTKCEKSFECATFEVPEDYTDLSGSTLTLHAIRHNAHQTYAGTLVVNPGGPGASGIDYVRNYDMQFGDYLASNFTITSWDPRGVGASSPVQCFSDAETDKLLASEGTPDTPAEVSAFVAEGNRENDVCAAKNGDLLNHVSTVETVKDLDIFRALLGEEKLNYLGKSYGTQIGAVYAHMFPDHVGRFVLDGAVDQSLGSTQMALDQAVAFDRAISRFALYCAKYAVVCDLGTSQQQIIDKIVSFVRGLDEHPLKTNDIKRPLTESLAWAALFGPMYSPDGGWDWLIEALHKAFKGDGSEMLAVADWINGRNADGTYIDNSTVAFGAIMCVDYPDDGSTPEKQMARFTAAAPISGPVLAWGEGSCAGWKGKGTPLPRDVSAPTANPILVIGTTYDPATPNQWAKALAKQLVVGRYLNFNGDGHTGYFSGSSCIDNIVEKFYRAGTLPADGKICQPDYPLIPTD